MQQGFGTGGAEKESLDIDIETILANAIRERNSMVAGSELLQEFQNEIDSAIGSSDKLNGRLEGLAAAARVFNIKREIPSRLLDAMKSAIIFSSKFSSEIGDVDSAGTTAN